MSAAPSDGLHRVPCPRCDGYGTELVLVCMHNGVCPCSGQEVTCELCEGECLVIHDDDDCSLCAQAHSDFEAAKKAGQQ